MRSHLLIAEKIMTSKRRRRISFSTDSCAAGVSAPQHDAVELRQPCLGTCLGLNAPFEFLMQAFTYRRAESPHEREAIFRLRYEAYLREREIGPIVSKRFSDPVDDEQNTFNFGVYIDDVLVGAIRPSVTMPGAAWLPAFAVFEDVLAPEIKQARRSLTPVNSWQITRARNDIPNCLMSYCGLHGSRWHISRRT
jgi:hypothetical protein